MWVRYPLITLSTRAQLESKRARSSVPDAVRRIVQREGITGLYSGLASALFGISVTNFVYYYCSYSTGPLLVLVLMPYSGYEWTRAALEKAALKAGRANKRLGTLEYMLAGAIAGCATVLITNPIWVINTRMTARKQGYTGEDRSGSEKKASPSTVGTLISLVRTEGLMSLFKGVLPALVLVTNPILQYTIFEQLRNMLAKRRKVTSTDAFYLGAIGKLLATTITYPYITIKSRMHVAAKGDAAPNTLEGFRQIVRDEGWAGLYNG